MAEESALYKKFRAEQDAADAKYKAWEADEWKKNEAEWTKQGYTRTINPNNTWGSTWSYKKPQNSTSGASGTASAGATPTVASTKRSEPPADAMKDWHTHMNNLGYKEEALADGTKRFINDNAAYYNNGIAFIGGKRTAYDYKTLPKAGYNNTAPAFSSYDDLMKLSWARESRLGANNRWVDENGLFITNLKKHTGKKFQTFVTTGLDGDHNDITYAYDPLTGNIRAMSENIFGRAGGWATAGGEGAVNNGNWGSLSDMLARYGITYKKQGGIMNRINYFQQGGVAPLQGNVQEQVISLVQAAMSGDQKATQTVNQIMEAAKAGDLQAMLLAQMIQQVVLQMQGQATSAKWGSKLQYIKSIKYAKGGKTCLACMKDGGKNDSTLVNGKYPKHWTIEQKIKYEQEHPVDESKVANEIYKTRQEEKKKNQPKKQTLKKACGGTATKKRYFGGWL